MQEKLQKRSLGDWLYQLFKGMLIGTGAILPGVSGGALAAIFGLYEPLITWLANITKNFWKNLRWFLPVGIGALLGVFVLAIPLDYGLQYYPVIVLWAFIGAILGTLPSLWKEAGKEGRQGKHIVLAIVVAILMFLFLLWASNNLDLNLDQNFLTWLFAGAIFASGFVVPGLSPSNFLIYFNLYQPLTEGIRTLDLSILIPVGIGGVLCVLLFSKAVRYLLDIAYPWVFHFVFGVVVASTVIIFPAPELYAGMAGWEYIATFILFIGGLALGLWMGKLEDEHKPEDL